MTHHNQTKKLITWFLSITTFVYHLDPVVVENLLVVLCLADRTTVEVEWQVPLAGFRAFYTLVCK
jgi:hypothetical protein